MRMKAELLISWMILHVTSHPVTHGIDSEQPMSSSWLEGDWSAENIAPEHVHRDNQSGCICRYKYNVHVVCYGGRKCGTFPWNITIPKGVYDLRVKTTNIEIVHRDDLQKLGFLQTLQIDANSYLQKLSPGVFKNMYNLRNLSISYNSQLKQLHSELFFGLIRLEKLRLIKNGFEKIIDATQALKSRYMPNLSSISLNENAFSGSGIGENAFAGMVGSNVTELELILCQIERIHRKAFLVFNQLKYLRLGDNLVTEDELSSLFEEFLDNNIPVTLLNLYNLGFRRDYKFTELLDIIGRLNVSHLVLSRNHIENISRGLFPFMPNIEYLDLREVSALTMETGALGQDVLPNLKVLYLAGNKLSGVLPAMLLPQLSTLDLSYNSGGAYSLSYFDIASSSMSGMKELKSLDLSYNRVSTITNSTFLDLQHLQILGLKNATIFYVTATAFSNLKQLQVLNLEMNPFQPFNSFETPIFNGLSQLRSLYLGSCKIVAFKNPKIFARLGNLQYLHLEDNLISIISPNLVAPLKSMIGIDLTDNKIQPWLNPIFENNTNLKIILLSRNRLSSLTASMMEDFVNRTRLDLSQNIFNCECQSFNGSISWFESQNFNASVTSLASAGHVCSSPEGLRDTQLVTFLDMAPVTCSRKSSKPKLTTGAYAVMGALASLSIILGIFSYFYRWHIRYWMFLVRMAFIRRHGWVLKKNKVHPSDYKYDVFVSYSHEDRNFIVRLVAMLENQEPFLKLCVYERDFEIGTVISDTVMEKVTSSRRTLLVVSNAFAKSQWCMWEMQLAEYQRLFFRPMIKDNLPDDRLIIIKLGPVAAANMTPTLKFLLKSRIYLEWSHDPKKEKIFWEKLRKSLANRNKATATTKVVNE